MEPIFGKHLQTSRLHSAGGRWEQYANERVPPLRDAGFLIAGSRPGGSNQRRKTNGFSRSFFCVYVADALPSYSSGGYFQFEILPEVRKYVLPVRGFSRAWLSMSTSLIFILRGMMFLI